VTTGAVERPLDYFFPLTAVPKETNSDNSVEFEFSSHAQHRLQR
jgi:hypothetical protein